MKKKYLESTTQPLSISLYPRKSNSYIKEAWLKLYENKLAFFGLSILIVLVLFAILVPFTSPYTYYETKLSLKNTSPCKKFWFGTDELGRDIFTRIWWGARISLFVGFVAAIIDMVIGVFYGAFAGMIGGKCEECMMRIADIFYSLPQILIVILLLVLFKPGVYTVILALSLTGWINMARIVRGQVLKIKKQDFVLAAYMCGAGHFKVLFRHLIPNAYGSIITTMTLTIPSAIFTEAFLSFLGLGVQAPIASWGTMANEGLSALRYYPWRLFFPALFISITMLSLNLLSDGIRDAFDHRLKR